MDQLRLLRQEAGFARFAEVGRRHRVLYQKMPYWCGSLSLGRSIDPRFTPLTLADVRLRKRLSFAGEPVTAAYLVPVSVPGQPLFVAWTTHGEQLLTSFRIDPALPGAAELPGLWREAFDALEGAATEAG